MADELDLLRRANPVPTDASDFGDGPLDARAERHLEKLLREPPPAPPSRPLPGRRSTRRGVRLAWGLAATAVVAVTALALLLGGPSTTPAVAAPRPLVVLADATPVPLYRLADRAEKAAADGGPGLRKGTHVQSWSLGMSEDEPPVTLPVERVVRWTADGRHTELVVATDPRHPGRPVLGEDEDGTPRLVDDGHVISRKTYPPSWSDAPPESRPPHDAGRLRAFLEEAQHTDSLGTPQLLDAVQVLLGHWTLGARESAALARLLADADGLRPVGQVTDRLGRRGQAYVYEGTAGVRRMLIMHPATGAVFGLETTFTEDQPEYGVTAGDVMEYNAWTR
ncbi:CU044_5270 family protein [Streptomyces thinghirensis]|uniref:CU044_5270 family protein n=1 Tax=Streptomyces thinghirensis TaxID=551547 RepID=A0ABP9T394_9ACTN